MAEQLITNSRALSFKKCRRRHWWEYEVGIRPETDAKALRMGTAAHRGLETLDKSGSLEAAVQEIQRCYARCPEKIDLSDWEIERETIECLVCGYEWRWKESRIKLVETEMSFRVPLENPDTQRTTPIFDLAGKIDSIVTLEDGRTAVRERKTLSDSVDQESDFWRQLAIDAQPTIYVYAARKLGHDVSSVLYDLIRKPSIRPEQVPILDDDGKKIVLDQDQNRVFNMKKTKEGPVPDKPRQTGDKEKGWTVQVRPMTPGEWSQKLLADIQERPTWYFGRNEIARLDSDVLEMQVELWELQKTIRDAQNHNRWFRTVHRDSCGFCPYFGLCSSKYQYQEGELPEGFILLEDVHPELSE